ncbi:MAG: hypothetical protein SVR94_15120 [Pseudomonadota bacterium]|nr:hypothetical protein [Pseudomonadota bacterium]
MSDKDRYKRAAERAVRDLNLMFEIVNKIFSFLFGGKKELFPFKINVIESSLDERIKKIDEARESLVEGLAAIDELKLSAKQNKQELEDAISKLEILRNEKSAAEEELDEIRNIATSDIEVFQKLANIPDKNSIFRERIIGFVSGILSSLFVVLIVQLFKWIF